MIFEMEQLFAAAKIRIPQAGGPRAAEGGVSVTVNSGKPLQFPELTAEALEFNDRRCMN